MNSRKVFAEAYPARTESLHVPPEKDVKAALSTALSEDYAESSVDIVDCPNMKDWGLPFTGLGGKGTLLDVGGEPFNHDPHYNTTVKHDIVKVCHAVGRDSGAVLGAGACCSEVIGGHLGELTVAVNLDSGANKSISAQVADDKSASAREYHSLLHGGICNLHITDGTPGRVFKITAKKRTGDQPSLAQTLRRGLSNFPVAVGMGGVFRVSKGKVKAHINPDASACPEGYYDDQEMRCIKPFLQFYEGETAMGPDLVCVSSLWSKDPTNGCLHLRSSGEHTHFFSSKGTNDAGHYHGDDPTSGGEPIEYEGYFALANEIGRVRDAITERLMDWGRMPTVAVLGAGAMGCLFGGLLAENGLEVTLIDKWEEHIETINKDGLKLTGVGGDRTLKNIAATSDITTVGPHDVVIVQCKAPATREAVESARHLFHDDTVAVSFQNGLGNEDVIAEVLGSSSKVLGGQTLQGAHVEGPGRVHIHTDLASYIGEWNGGSSSRCGRLARILSEHGVPCHEDSDMKKRIWMKAIYNCVVSPLSSLTNLAHRDVYRRHDSGWLADVIIKEALAVATAEGLEVSDEEGRECLDKVIASNQANKSSMCMDILAKRVSEMDYINGRIVALAQKHGIDVPMNRAMVFFVKGLESHFADH